MKTLYLDCGMGAAGDMLTAALLELLPDRDGFVAALNALGIPGVVFTAEPAEKCGVRGTHMAVRVHGEEEGEHEHHHHSGLHDVEHIVSHLRVSEKVRADVLAVYTLIAEAESHVHGCPVTQIHFHEVGALDAIADVTAVCLLMERLAPDEVIASPIHVGSGTVKCAHGILPVPAPATAYLLRGVPIYGGEIAGELCTPTGAALLRHFVSRFGPLPALRVEAIGYGMGKKDFPAANCVRAMLGETDDTADEVCELHANLDDMTAEDIAFAAEQTFAAGALDVWTTPIGMKKGRPGTMLTALCRPAQREAVVRALFRHTTTLGVRFSRLERCTLRRAVETRETPFGAVRVKTAAGCGVTREKLEHDDLERLAQETGLPLAELRRRIERGE